MQPNAMQNNSLNTHRTVRQIHIYLPKREKSINKKWRQTYLHTTI